MTIQPIRSSVPSTTNITRRSQSTIPEEHVPSFEQARADAKIIKPKKAELKHDKTVNEVITASEKDFFVQMFPESETEIRSYNSYQADGSRSTVQLGTMIDRKG
jgi:hypothetical protein